MKNKFLLTIIAISLFASSFANNFNNFESAFKSFCFFQKIEITNAKIVINEKNEFIELLSNESIIQFGKYTTSKGEEIYVYNKKLSENTINSRLTLACYKYVNDQWIEVTDEVLPMINFNDFYGPNSAPPKSFTNIAKFNFEVQKNNFIKMKVVPNWTNEDSKKQRIFEQKKYKTLQLKWNKNTGKFEINKWLL